MIKRDIKRFTQLEPVIQGEGNLTGIPMILVRLRGCNLECVFCDTDVNGTALYSIDDFTAMLKKYFDTVHWVMITGGEPSIQPSVIKELSNIARGLGYKIEVESNGTNTIDPSLFDHINISPKLSNAEAGHTEEVYQTEEFRDRMLSYGSKASLKFVYTGAGCMASIGALITYLGVAKRTVYIMPEGATRKEINIHKQKVFDLCIANGYIYCDRIHIL